ncbi:MAG: hypothetical protein IPO43_18640 [Rhodoferax sp.]|nr:hypothetical protein [Rhodoferax sp.]
MVMTAGMDATQKQAMLAAACPTCCASWAQLPGPAGAAPGSQRQFCAYRCTARRAGLVSQSGALVTAMLDWAQGRGIGFSHFVSMNEHADVDFGDMLDYLASDPKTQCLFAAHRVRLSRRASSCRRARRRAQQTGDCGQGRALAQGQLAAASHTGALAGFGHGL